MGEIILISWNIGGGEYLKTVPSKRKDKKKQINNDLDKLINEFMPHVILLQEIVQFDENGRKEDLI